jgi:hypothetical protein
MRRVLTSWGMLGALALWGLQGWGLRGAEPSRENLKLTLRPDRTEIFAYEPLSLTALVANTSKDTVMVAPFWASLKFEVAGEDGAFQEWASGSQRGAGASLEWEVPPDRVLVSSELLFTRDSRRQNGTMDFIFEREGTYRVRAGVIAGRGPKYEQLISAEIKIVVKALPAEEKEAREMITRMPLAWALWSYMDEEQFKPGQELVRKYPKSVFADQVTFLLGEYLERMAPKDAATEKETFKKAYDCFGAVSERQDGRKLRALMSQGKLVVNMAEMVTKEEKGKLTKALKSGEKLATEMGLKKEWEELLGKLEK